VPDREVLNDERHPVVAGLVALIGVGLAVGLIAGLAALVGVQVLGLGNAGASSRATEAQSLYLPKPKPTKGPSGPLVTLPGEPSSSPAQGEKKPKGHKSEKPKQEDEITLSASQTAVAPMEQIDLTGVYPGGEGAILQVQRFTGGKWTDFPVTVSVSDETFSTYVQTSQPGPNRFQVVDTDTGKTSNEVKVTVG
jgi:hypothetical protein